MLYVASALPSTAVTHAINVPNLTSSDKGSASLVVAKGNTIEVWDLTPDGLVEVCKTDVWGMVVGLEWVGKVGQTPHIVVLTDHPLSRLLLYRVRPLPHPTLDLTSSRWIHRNSRTSEFLTGLVADRAGGTVVASLYVGMLSVIEIGSKDEADESGSIEGKGKGRSGVGKGKKRERKGTGDSMVPDEAGHGEILGFTDSYEISIREFNLLSLAFIPPFSPTSTSHTSSILTFLYLTPDYTINLIAKTLDRPSKTFTDVTNPIDILSPPPLAGAASSVPNGEVIRDFSVPAAKRLLAIPEGVLVIGDEFCATYSLTSTPIPTLTRNRTGSMTSNKQTGEKETLATPDSKRRKNSVGGTYNSPTPPSNADAGKLGWVKGWRVRQGFGEINGAVLIQTNEGREVVLLGDTSGRLSMVRFTSQGGSPRPSVKLLGETSPASSIAYLDNGHVFIGSECGDCQIIRLSDRPSLAQGKGKGKAMDLMQIDEDEEGPVLGPVKGGNTGFVQVDSWPNIAPVMDFCVVQGEGGGSSQVVTASGLSSTGSIRVVHSGVGSEVIANIEGVEDTSDLFSFSYGSQGDTGVIISTTEASLIARVIVSSISDEPSLELEAVSPEDLPYVSTSSTLAISQISPDVLAQVTPLGVSVIDLAGSKMVAEWKDLQPEDRVLAASCEGNSIILGLTDGSIVYLTVDDNQTGSGVQAIKRVQFGQGEIASIAFGPIKEGSSAPSYAVAGVWGSNAIKILSLPDLESIGESTETSLPRSIVVRPDSTSDKIGDLLLVGLGDGTVSSRRVNATPTALHITDKKLMALGRTPVQLSSPATSSDKAYVLSVSDRLSILYEEQDRLSRSSLNVAGITAACGLEVPHFGTCLVVAGVEGLQIRSISSLNKIHIKKVDLGRYVPTNIKHHPSARVFGVALIHSEVEQEYGDEESSSYFRLYDERSLTACAEFPLDEGEKPVSLSLVQLEAEGPQYFALGTTYDSRPNDAGASNSGYLRLIQVRIDSTSGTPPSMEVVGMIQMNGTVYDIKAIWGKLAVAVDHRIDLLDFSPLVVPEFRTISTWGSAFFASCLTVQTLVDNEGETVERLHVGDGMRSIFVLKQDAKGHLVDVARDMRPHWVITMEELDADGGAVAFSDTNFNLLTIRHKDNKLENAAGLAMHETITRMHRGTLAPAGGNLSSNPEILFATSSGRIGVVADLNESESEILRQLQLNMENLITGPEIVWSRYREIHTEGNSKPRPAVGFIDGDFVKRFMDLPADSEKTSLVLEGPNEFSRVGDALRVEVNQLLGAVGSVHR